MPSDHSSDELGRRRHARTIARSRARAPTGRGSPPASASDETSRAAAAGAACRSSARATRAPSRHDAQQHCVENRAGRRCRSSRRRTIRAARQVALQHRVEQRCRPPARGGSSASGALKPCHTREAVLGQRSADAPGAPPTSRTGPMVSAGKMPTTRQASTSNSIGTRIQRGGSCGSRGRPAGGGAEEHAVDEAQRIGHANTPQPWRRTAGPVSHRRAATTM